MQPGALYRVWYPVYMIQPIVKPVVQPAVLCKQTSNRLSNRFDNKLYRVNGAWEVLQEMVEWVESAQWSTKLEWCKNVFHSGRKVISDAVAWKDDGSLVPRLWSGDRECLVIRQVGQLCCRGSRMMTTSALNVSHPTDALSEVTDRVVPLRLWYVTTEAEPHLLWDSNDKWVQLEMSQITLVCQNFSLVLSQKVPE